MDGNGMGYPPRYRDDDDKYVAAARDLMAANRNKSQLLNLAIIAF